MSTIVQFAYKRIIEDMRDGVLVLDAQSRVVELNPAAEKMLGIPAEKAIGERVCQFICCDPGLSAALENEVGGEEIQLVGKIDQLKYEIQLLPIRDAMRALTGWTMTLSAVDGQFPGGKESLLNGEKFHQVIAELRTLEQRLRAIFENAAIGIAIVDRDGQYIQGNDYFAEMLGYTHEELRKMPYIDIAHPEDRELVSERMGSLVKGELDSYHIERRFVTKDGLTFWANLSVATIRNSENELEAMIGIMTDITERKWAEEAERMARETAEELATETQDALFREQRLNEVTRIISSNLDANIILQNVVRLSAEMLSASCGVIILVSEDGNTIADMFQHNFPESVDSELASWEKELSWFIVETGDILLLPDGHNGLLDRIPDRLKTGLNELLPKNHKVEITGLISVPIAVGEKRLGALTLLNFNGQKVFDVRDLTLLQSIGLEAGIAIQNACLFKEVEQLATSDSLTGLLNRRYFFELAQKELTRAHRYHSPLSVILLDIDHFKRVNDRFGHLAGDQVLCMVADACRAELRECDRMGCYGGEEFVMLLVETGSNGALFVAERIREKIAKLAIKVEGGTVFITASLGGATMEDAETEIFVETLLERADQAMYASKRAGRNRVAMWQQDMKDIENSDLTDKQGMKGTQ